MGAFIDLSGQRFGRLLAVERVGTSGGGALWLCKCDCGQEHRVRANALRVGATLSCGCLQKEVARKTIIENSYIHGGEPHRLYVIWMRMNSRCNSKTAHFYHRYGGRGITICDEWRSFICFRNWALANGYEDNLTLDRIDNDGNYSPDNCRWADWKTQANNTSTNVYVEINGEWLSFTSAARKLGVNVNTARNRVFRGMTHEEALLTPIKSRGASTIS